MTTNFVLRFLVAVLALVVVCSAANFQVPARLHHAAHRLNVSSNSSGKKPLINALGVFLIGAIEVGGPGQPLLVDFSLISTFTYLYDGEVFGQECGLCFNKSYSHTFKDLRKDFDLPGMSGHWSADTYKVAGYQFRQKFPLIDRCTDCEPLFDAQPVALARYVGEGSFLSNVAPHLDAPMISVWAERKPFGLPVANASVTFGAIDDHCTWGRNSFFVNLTEPKPQTQSDPWSATWMFHLDSITFQGPSSAKSKMRIARNTTVWMWHGILAPWDDLKPIAKKLRATYDGAEGFVVDCANLKRLPTLRFMIGQRSIRLKPLEYTYEVDGTCYLSFKATEWFFEGPPIPVWIVGTHFFANHCFIGDFGANRIGFAEKKKIVQ